MSAGAAPISGNSPAEVYSSRLHQLEQEQASEQQKEKALGIGKLVLGFLILIAAIVLIHHPIGLELLAIPAAAFIFLSVRHEQRIRSLRSRRRAMDYYLRGIERLENRWAGKGETGERFFEDRHPYARDLDLFGPASLFELLCTSRTPSGEKSLAEWILHRAPAEEILARQSAVSELRDRVSFREALFTAGDIVRVKVHPEILTKWGQSAAVFPERWIRSVTSIAGVAWVLAMIAWGVWGWGTLALAVSVLNLSWAHRLHSRFEAAADAIETAAEDLLVFASLLQILEKEGFSSSKLVQLRAALQHEGTSPSRAIRRLARIVEHLESRRNPAMRLLDVLTFWSAQFVFAAERWQHEFGPSINTWLAAVGEFEALAALSTYAYEHPDDVFPELVADGPVFDAEGIAHPLLPSDHAIRNDVSLGGDLRLIVLSGPNMAGKSTFIRCIGVNAVLGQCGAPVRATRLTLSPLNVAASICVLDSLSGGVSRFYAEISRLKLAMNLTREPVPVLFLLDELLSGTNSNDRLAGTRLVVRGLVDRGAIGVVSTHDLALAQIPEDSAARARNFHFEDQLQDGLLVFDYKLKPGVVTSSNALELMRSIGLGTE